MAELYRGKYRSGIHVYMVSTRNYLDTVSTEDDANMRSIALKELGQRKNEQGEDIPNFIVFDPTCNLRRIEDQGRTVRIPIFRGKLYDKKIKVYVKLDDYGSPEELSRHVGQTVNTQYVVTFMLAEDY